MYKLIAVLAATACFVCLGAEAAEKAPDVSQKATVIPAAAEATIVAVKGNVVTIADAQGRKQELEVADVKGLTTGTRVGWCEEDCRSLRLPDRSIEVKRVVPAKP